MNIPVVLFIPARSNNEILETSQNSNGSAQHEQEVYLTSIQGKLNQLEASWQSLSTNLLNSEIFRKLTKECEQL